MYRCKNIIAALSCSPRRGVSVRIIKMKIAKLATIFLISISLLASTCSNDNNPFDPLLLNGFAIYFLQDSHLTYSDIMNEPINSLKIANTPVATEKYIDCYKIFRHPQSLSLAHAIKYKRNMKQIFGDLNRPFIVIADGKRIYFGEYWAHFMNTNPPDIFIYPYTNSEFHIMSNENAVEKINDDRIIKTLKESGIEIIH
jgi:hypothetical protein